MRFPVVFKENKSSLTVNFGEVHNISDGGYERGYADGYSVGYEKGDMDGQEKGYTEGYETGKSEGFADGKADGYTDGLMDYVQDYGKKTDYSSAFKGGFWTDNTFKPNHDMKPTSMGGMFQQSQITDINKSLEECSVIIDTSNCTNYSNILYQASSKSIPTIDMAKCTSTTQMFRYAYSVNNVTIINIKPTYGWTNNAFNNCWGLTNLFMYGEIGMGLTHTIVALTAESAKTILLALKDYSGTDEAHKYTLSLNAGTWTNLNADGELSPNGNTWREYADDKGWKT